MLGNRDILLRPAIAIVVFSALLGLAYPLVVTGVSQVVFSGRSDGSRVEVDGRVVGSELIGQDFGGLPRYFQSRPSVTGYAADASSFANLGPNSRELSEFFEEKLDAYLELEGRYDKGLTAADVPVDAVANSASGVDPLISQANARIQAHRVAVVRDLPLDRVLELVSESTDDRDLGVLGEPGVNVLRLNIALDEESRKEPRR
jgi:K+-transporting ATPase ATPase C chain